MSTEDHVLRIVFDGSSIDKGLAQSRADIDGLQKKADATSGKLGGVSSALKSIDSAERQASKALRGLGDSFGGVNTTMGKTVGLVGDLSGLFAGGGALATGIAGSTFALSSFLKMLEDITKARDEAFKEKWRIADSISGSVQDANAELDKLQRKLRDLREGDGASDNADTDEKLRRSFEGIQERRDALIALEDDLDRKLAKTASAAKMSGGRSGSITADKELSDYREKREAIESEILLLEAENKTYQKILSTRKDIAEIENKNKDKGGKTEKATDYFALVDKDLGEEIKKDNQRAFEDRANKAQEMFDEAVRAEQAISDEAEFEFKFRMRLMDEEAVYWKSFQDQKVADAQGAAGVLAGSMQTFFTMQIEGSKYAAEVAASEFLIGIGNQLVGMGIKDAFEAGGMAIRADPRSVPMGVLAAAEIAAGLGMGAGGAAIGANVANKEEKAEASAKAAEQRRERKQRNEEARRSGGGTGSGGGDGVTVIINYGVGGPPSESTARHVADAVDTARRNGFGPYGGRRDSWR